MTKIWLTTWIIKTHTRQKWPLCNQLYIRDSSGPEHQNTKPEDVWCMVRQIATKSVKKYQASNGINILTKLIEIEYHGIPTKEIRNRKKDVTYPIDKKTLGKINLKHKLCKKVIAKRGSVKIIWRSKVPIQSSGNSGEKSNQQIQESIWIVPGWEADEKFQDDMDINSKSETRSSD